MSKIKNYASLRGRVRRLAKEYGLRPQLDTPYEKDVAFEATLESIEVLMLLVDF